MTVVVTDAAGPRIEAVPIEERASFRIILCYDIATDDITCRIDTKIGESQNGGRLCIARPQPKSGERISRSDPLIEPKGVISATAFVADRKTLIEVLEQMANHLRNAK